LDRIAETQSPETPGDLLINWGGDNLLGLADEIRISDTIRYADNFTRPAAPFVCDANTKALWHFDEPEGSTVFHDVCGTEDNYFTGYNGAHTEGVIPLTCYTLTLAHTGSGGDPTASPANSSSCSSGRYHAGETISLTSYPDPGWAVGSWNGTSDDASTSTTDTLTMPASDWIVSANYFQPCYTLNHTHTGSGSDPTVLPINSTGCSSGKYHAGEAISLTANPEAGWAVGSWNGTNDDASTSTANSLIMPTSDMTITANYIHVCYTLTRAHTGSGGAPTALPVNSNGCSSGKYYAGEAISLTADPAINWIVGSWSGTVNDASTSTTNSLTMPASDRTVTANYINLFKIFLPLAIR
jgi:hypothetical protein